MRNLLARSVHGLEWVVADEVSMLDGVSEVALDRREVRFRTSGPIRAAMGLRTIDDLLLEVSRLPSPPRVRADLPGFGAQVARLGWPDALAAAWDDAAPAHIAAFDVVAGVEGRRPFNRFELESAVGGALARSFEGTYLERTASGRAEGTPDLTVRIFVRENETVVAMRVAPAPLHRRPYKQDTGPGTLHPPLAAALGRLAAPPRAGVILDPFCGDGTIAIEAALMRPDATVLARDIDAARYANTQANAARANVVIDVERADAASSREPPAGIDAILTNPPWSRAVGLRGPLARARSLAGYWRAAAALLSPSGVLACVADNSLELPALLRSGGWSLSVQQQVRISGRLAHIVVALPPGGTGPGLGPGPARWRETAVERGVITAVGF